ncbi:MAG: glycosyltransferase [Deltaproteobacteria bacterium]|jgi:glycosyltransferase involved in cell wall biosynthesis|nr:glycosyltransferase [Deltaproteobacteria bacterium]
MSIYNGEAHLAETMESVLGQTFADFAFLIIDDASTDVTAVMLARYAAMDRRVKILTNKYNLGLTASLNKGLALVDTPYVARMDADDISLPERLEKQLARMTAQPGIAALGTWVEPIGPAGEMVEASWFAYIRQFADPADIRKALLQGYSVLVHPSAMMRTEVVKSIGAYRTCFRYAQDYDLWLRLTEVGEPAVLPEVLLRYRVSSHSLSVTQLPLQMVGNVCALASALIRSQGRDDPLKDRKTEVDRDSMAALAEAAGAKAYNRWLEYCANGEYAITKQDMLFVFEKGIPAFFNDEMFKILNAVFRAHTDKCKEFIEIIEEKLSCIDEPQHSAMLKIKNAALDAINSR